MKRGRPATGETPKRYFRMTRESWDRVEQAAIDRGQTTSDFIRQVLCEAVREHESKDAAEKTRNSSHRRRGA